jgi:endonuclease G, mitochondrial
MKQLTTTLVLAVILAAISISSFSQDTISMALGNPSGAASDTLNKDNYLIVRPQYCLSYSNSNHIPNWVCWHVGSTDLGTIKPQNNFRSDSTLPSGWYRVKPTDYQGSGFDRGQMCSPGDRTSSAENNSVTFLTTNMVPQAPNNNRITWEHLETYCRKLVGLGNELYIISGPFGQGGTGSNGFALELKHNILVPTQVWKIIVVLPEGSDDLKRIADSTRVISVLIPNNQECSQKDWGEYRVSVGELQSLTRYNFLSNVPKDIQKVIEAKVDHGGTN